MWIAIKIVDFTLTGRVVGCAVGPFDTEDAAQAWADKAVIGALGHEKWHVRELQEASQL